MTQSPPTKTDLTLRPVKSEDVPFLMDSWMESARSVYQFLDNDLFYPAYREQFTRLLKDAQVRICVLRSTGEIVGYSVSSDAKKVLHWVYIKWEYRGKGFSRLLIEHLGEYPRTTLSTPHARKKLRLGRIVPPAFMGQESKA